jgi:hypothetical protein
MGKSLHKATQFFRLFTTRIVKFKFEISIDKGWFPWFSIQCFSVAEETIGKVVSLAVRVYEQEQGEHFGSPLLGLYARR